jgi:hypothetical protein
MSASLVDECYRRACDAKRSAEMATIPSQKTHFSELEQRWLRAASTVASKTSLGGNGTAELKILNARKRRPRKFTPERLEQIRNLIALGKSKEEIAELLGVTVGTLQVTCSKRGISLRRPKLDTGLDSPGHEVPHTAGPIPSPVTVNSVRFAFKQVDELVQGALHNETAAPRPDDIEPQQGNCANLALTMYLRGRRRTVPLRLSNEVITALALESQLRETSLGQLVGEIVAGAVAAGLSGMLDEPRRADAA